MYSSAVPFNIGARRVWVVNFTPRPLYFRERDLVHIVQEGRWATGRSERVRKISPSSEFDRRTVQRVTTRYTDYAILAHLSLSSSCVKNSCAEQIIVLIHVT